jgi:predicted Fe-Mo cluster-binding NifX family protein
MKAAFATWENRIAPLFDAARYVHIVQIDCGRIASQRCERLRSDTPARKVMHMAELGVDMLICGAISKPVHAILSAQGIRVISFVSGDLHEIIQAWIAGKIGDNSFAMPGQRGGLSGRKDSGNE